MRNPALLPISSGICPVCNFRPKADTLPGTKRKRRGYCLECHAAYMRKTRPRHSEMSAEQRQRANCRAYTNVLIRRGTLKKEPCCICAAPAQAHHPDYGNPRLVEWYCKLHHVEVHRVL